MLVYFFAILMICVVAYCIYEMWPSLIEKSPCPHKKRKNLGLLHTKILKDVFWCPTCGSLGLKESGKMTIWYDRQVH